MLLLSPGTGVGQGSVGQGGTGPAYSGNVMQPISTEEWLKITPSLKWTNPGFIIHLTGQDTQDKMLLDVVSDSPASFTF